MIKYESFIEEELKLSSEVVKSLNPKNTLYPKFWNKLYLNEIVKHKLINIATGFIKEVELPKGTKIKDITFTGSLANYNWSKFSDIDVHIILDFNQFGVDKEIVTNYFLTLKKIWGEEKEITIDGFDVEIYMQDVHDEIRFPTYSLLTDTWYVKPNKENIKFDVNKIKDKFNFYVKLLENIKTFYNEKEYKTAFKLSEKLKNKIRKHREIGLNKKGEFSFENIVFKALRRSDFFEELIELKNKAYSKLMSYDIK